MMREVVHTVLPAYVREKRSYSKFSRRLKNSLLTNIVYNIIDFEYVWCHIKMYFLDLFFHNTYCTLFVV